MAIEQKRLEFNSISIFGAHQTVLFVYIVQTIVVVELRSYFNIVFDVNLLFIETWVPPLKIDHLEVSFLFGMFERR